MEIEARELRETIKAQDVQGRKHNHGLGKLPSTANTPATKRHILRAVCNLEFSQNGS